MERDERVEEEHGHCKGGRGGDEAQLRADAPTPCARRPARAGARAIIGREAGVGGGRGILEEDVAEGDGGGRGRGPRWGEAWVRVEADEFGHGVALGEEGGRGEEEGERQDDSFGDAVREDDGEAAEGLLRGLGAGWVRGGQEPVEDSTETLQASCSGKHWARSARCIAPETLWAPPSSRLWATPRAPGGGT